MNKYTCVETEKEYYAGQSVELPLSLEIAGDVSIYLDYFF